jgi:hypothetical protein
LAGAFFVSAEPGRAGTSKARLGERSFRAIEFCFGQGAAFPKLGQLCQLRAE